MPRFIVSQAGVDLIKGFEGLRLDAYPDPVSGGDPWTIGYGDTGPDVVPGLWITRDEAERRLAKRLADDFGRNVNEQIGDALTTQAQFDAMVSLAYNIGNGGFNRSSVLRAHKAGLYLAASNAFLMWNKAGGREIPALTRRRGVERVLYLSEIPGFEAKPDRPTRNPETVIMAIKALQTALVPYGYAGKIDGAAGPMTQAALAEFRRSR